MTGQYLFFPFSHISQEQLDALEAFFPAITFFPVSTDLKHQPRLQKSVEIGTVFPVFLSQEDLCPVDHAFEQYLTWARVHRGNEHNLRLLVKDNPYFTSDSDLTAIKSQIKGTGGPKQSEKESLHKDLLFLKMARQCDQEKENIDLQLRTVDKKKDKIFSALLGSEAALDVMTTGKETGPHDPGTMMTRERLHAWIRCMTYYSDVPKTCQGRLFVTTSEAVVDYLESICSDVINALDIDLIKVHENDCENKIGWQQQLVEQLMCAAKGDSLKQGCLPDVKDSCSRFGQIKLFLFSGNNIHSLFNLEDKQMPVCLIGLK